MVRVKVRIRFSVWLVSGYTHVFTLDSVVIVTLPAHAVRVYAHAQFSEE